MKSALFASLASVCTAGLWPSIKFGGTYSDPNHPDCPRTITPTGPVFAEVRGDDPITGTTCSATNEEAWGPLSASIDGDQIVVDFSPKGGPSDLTGSYAFDKLANCHGIAWDDGNFWPKTNLAYDTLLN